MAAVTTSYYKYDPSVVAAAIFAILYTVSFLATFVQWIKYRAWIWCVMVLASLMECLGYIARLLSAKHVDNRGLYIIQFCLVILAPVLMAAALYIVFGRIVYHVVPPSSRTARLLWVPPRFITPIFVACDTFAFLVQLYGAVLVAGTQASDKDAAHKLNEGKYIVLAGLGIQIAAFGLFSIVAFRFHFTSKRFGKEFDDRFGGTAADKYYTVGDRKNKLKRSWMSLLAVVNIGCGLILIRSVYRVVEFSLGKGGYIDSHEYFAYLLDALPMFPCIALFIWWHPGKYLPYLGFRLPEHIRKGGEEISSMPLTGYAAPESIAASPPRYAAPGYAGNEYAGNDYGQNGYQQNGYGQNGNGADGYGANRYGA